MSDIEILTIEDPDYPCLLRYIDRPPSLLHRQGVKLHGTLPTISIVGSLNPSIENRRLAEDIAKRLSKEGFLIASGLARGIDTSAHVGALKAGGKTIAVVGSGLKKIYPKQNATLAREIVQNGAILSEYGAEEPVSKWRLVQRNRILAGLSLAVVVIEPDKGSLHTVRWALKYNRFALLYRIGMNTELFDLQTYTSMKVFQDVDQIFDLLSNLHSVDPKSFNEDRQLLLFS